MHVYIYTYVYIYIYSCTSIYMHICIYIFICLKFALFLNFQTNNNLQPQLYCIQVGAFCALFNSLLFFECCEIVTHWKVLKT